MQISARTRIGQYIDWILSPTSSSVFKARGKKILANAVKTSAEVANDVLEDKTVNESAKRRIPTGIKRMLLGLDRPSGSGIRRRKRRKIARDI